MGRSPGALSTQSGWEILDPGFEIQVRVPAAQ
jgi:hypothetical protein